jgi:hypothetical protein
MLELGLAVTIAIPSLIEFFTYGVMTIQAIPVNT